MLIFECILFLICYRSWHLTSFIWDLIDSIFQLFILYFQNEIFFFYKAKFLFICKSELPLFFKLFTYVHHLLTFWFFLTHLWCSHLWSVKDCTFGSICELKSRKSLSWCWYRRTYTDNEPHFSLAQQRVT